MMIEPLQYADTLLRNADAADDPCLDLPPLTSAVSQYRVALSSKYDTDDFFDVGLKL